MQLTPTTSATGEQSLPIVGVRTGGAAAAHTAGAPAPAPGMAAAGSASDRPGAAGEGPARTLNTQRGSPSTKRNPPARVPLIQA